jgi:hypothetical protein
VAGLLQQAQLLTTTSAFLSGCKSRLKEADADVHAVNSSGDAKGSDNGPASISAAHSKVQDTNLESGRHDRQRESAEVVFWKPLTVSLRCIAKSASKVRCSISHHALHLFDLRYLADFCKMSQISELCQRHVRKISLQQPAHISFRDSVSSETRTPYKRTLYM